ncbi:MAG: hypothetical protein JNK79_10855 [Chitinophagaceae bacterium]|nr:hypothetical protein [Chitinophagaceae bacterium]
MDQPSQSQNLFELQVDHLASSYLNDAAKWAKFLAIIGFIFCILIVLAGLFAGSMMGALYPSLGGGAAAAGAGFFAFFFIVLALVYFFPCLYLYRFASQVQSAIRSNEQTKLQNSLKNLRAHYRYVGILMIIMLVFYVFAFFFQILGAAYM